MRIGRFFTIDRAAITALIVVVVDLLSKSWAFSATTPGDEVDVIPGITIGQTRNEGIAFGFFAGRPWIVFGLMGIALSVLVYFYLRHRSRPGLWLATGLLLGGAIGNAIDRISLGYVRDFINFPHFPTFNLADVSITAGVIILVLTAERYPEDDHDDGQEEAEDAQHRTV
jgi:signal peptidase II